MSNITRRSKSTPHLTISLIASDDSAVEPKPPASLRKQKSFIFDHTFTPKHHGSSPITGTPLLEREDPFNLSGFFPGPLTAGTDQQWNWLRAQESDSSDEEDESEIDPSMPHTPILADADLLIRSEDKMGILTLSNLLETMKTDGIGAEMQLNLMSPYDEDDDVLDSADSLYDTFKARRLASERLEDASLYYPAGGLFSPVEENEDQPQGWYGYIQSIFL